MVLTGKSGPDCMITANFPGTAARRGSGKRDLEGILGRDDHQLVLKIIEENKELLSSSTTSSLTAQVHCNSVKLSMEL